MDAMFYSTGILTALAFFAALVAAGLGGWALRGRTGEHLAPAPRRLLSQAAMETQSIGLALRRIAGMRGRCAVETHGLALQLLDVSDQLDDMLANSHGPRRLHEECVALLPLVEDCLATARVQLGADARHCRIHASLEGVALHGDGRALRGALVQVLLRAARLTNAQDVIEMRFGRLGGMVAIIIEDEGVGAPAGDLAAQAPARGTRGIGFGLGLARSLLQAHGGDLVFESASGVGTRAWLTLPESRLLSAAQPAQA
jgi:signal transduction histidine kinase